MARLAKAGVAKSTGSLRICAPAGMTTEGCPLKVRLWSEAVSMAVTEGSAMVEGARAPGATGHTIGWGAGGLDAVAMLAASMRRGSVPNSLVKRTRSVLPAMEVWTISRRVESMSVGGSRRESLWGDAAQVPTQACGAGLGAAVCAERVPARSAGSTVRRAGRAMRIRRNPPGRECWTGE